MFLDAVREARELMLTANREWFRAVRRAHDAGHSTREIARAAGGLSHTRIHKILQREENES
jgi:hypothetical protein